MSETEKTKCLIIGSGPAGYTAAIYASRANLQPILYEGLQPGGQLTTTHEVENFPGYPDGISGPKMMEQLKQQSAKFGTDIRSGFITEADFSSYPFKLIADNNQQIEAKTVIIATGASANYLGLESENKFKGMGVSACAVCDGFFYKGKDVAVVGGGDVAVGDALYLSQICKKVYMIVRRDELRASKILQKRISETDNIEIMWNHNVSEVLGDIKNGVTGIKILNNKTDKENIIDIHGLFIAIGHTPNTEIFKQYINTDENGYILTNPGSCETNIKGVFACGDVQDKKYKQAITAAGTGAMAALDAEKFLIK